ncbi:MAG: VOC family protein [Rhizobacter sp.]|nr:VOC family protein [Chlorobiales bacterium]
MLNPTGVSQITLRVNNLRRAEEFYMKIMGFKLHHRLGVNMTYLEAGGDSLVLVRAETPSSRQARDIRVDHFGFKLATPAEVDEAALLFKEENVHMLTTPANRRDGRAFFVLDPDGNMIEIYSSTGEIFSTDDTNPDKPSSKRRGRKAKPGAKKPRRPVGKKRRRSRK